VSASVSSEGGAEVVNASTKALDNRSWLPRAADWALAALGDWGAAALSLLLPVVGTFLIGLGARGEAQPAAPTPPQQQQAPIPLEQDLNWLPLSWGIALVALGIVFNLLDRSRTKAKLRNIEAKRERHLTRFNDELASVIAVFVELLRSDKGEDASQRFFSSAVREARHLIGHPGTRICVYQLEFQEEDDLADVATADTAKHGHPRPLLVRKAYGGRADPPRATFTPDTPFGNTVISIARGTTAVPIADPADRDFEINRDPDAVWCSTLLVPLKLDNDSKGILMIDTRDPVDEFTNEDVSVGWTIANIIALGMGSLVQGGQDPRPEVREVRQLLAHLPDDLPALDDAQEGVDTPECSVPAVSSPQQEGSVTDGNNS